MAIKNEDAQLSLNDFIKKNDSDIRKLIVKQFKNFLKGRNELEDILQDVYLTMHRRDILSKYDPSRNTKLSTWLMHIIKNHLCAYINHYQDTTNDALDHKSDTIERILKLENSSKRLEGIIDASAYDKKAGSPEDYASTLHDWDYFTEHLKEQHYTGHVQSNGRRRDLVTLLEYYKQGHTDTEIAEKLELTIAGVGAMKRQLRSKLQKFFPTVKPHTRVWRKESGI